MVTVLLRHAQRLDRAPTYYQPTTSRARGTVGAREWLDPRTLLVGIVGRCRLRRRRRTRGRRGSGERAARPAAGGDGADAGGNRRRSGVPASRARYEERGRSRQRQQHGARDKRGERGGELAPDRVRSTAETVHAVIGAGRATRNRTGCRSRALQGRWVPYPSTASSARARLRLYGRARSTGRGRGRHPSGRQIDAGRWSSSEQMGPMESTVQVFWRPAATATATGEGEAAWRADGASRGRVGRQGGRAAAAAAAALGVAIVDALGGEGRGEAAAGTRGTQAQLRAGIARRRRSMQSRSPSRPSAISRPLSRPKLRGHLAGIEASADPAIYSRIYTTHVARIRHSRSDNAPSSPLLR